VGIATRKPVLMNLSFEIRPDEKIKAAEGTPIGVIKAIVVDRAIAITKGTGLIPNTFAASIPIGSSIAAVALFERKPVSAREIRLNRTISIVGVTPSREARALLICPAIPETIIASPNKRLPPTRNINSHWIDFKSFRSSSSSPNIVKTASIDTIAALEIDAGSPSHSSI
jgi:hypothetical protein